MYISFSKLYIYIFRQFHNWSVKPVKRRWAETLLLTDRISLALADTSAQTFQVSLAIRTLCDKPTLVPDCLNRSHLLLQLCRDRTNSDSKHPSSWSECKELLGNYSHHVLSCPFCCLEGHLAVTNDCGPLNSYVTDYLHKNSPGDLDWGWEIRTRQCLKELSSTLVLVHSRGKHPQGKVGSLRSAISHIIPQIFHVIHTPTRV